MSIIYLQQFWNGTSVRRGGRWQLLVATKSTIDSAWDEMILFLNGEQAVRTSLISRLGDCRTKHTNLRENENPIRGFEAIEGECNGSGEAT